MADYAGVSFDGVHSYDEWGLRLVNIDIGFPEAKTYYVDVPGMDGKLDLTESMQDGIKYENRTLTFTFDARYATYTHWAGLLSLIAGVIQGKKIEIILDIDSGYYYVGRCMVSTEKSNSVNATVVVECDCEPYKYAISTSDEPWLWDPFSFIDGVAASTADVVISSTSSWQAVTIIGQTWNELTIVSTAAMTMKYGDTEYAIASGTNEIKDIELGEGEQTLYFKGSGTITIIHRGGRL